MRSTQGRDVDPPRRLKADDHSMGAAVRRLDQFLRDKCVAVGLDPDEMDQLFDESPSVGPVLARITAAESDQMRAAATARREAVAAGVPVGVGTTRWRRDHGPSYSMSVRLDHDEADELRRRAADRGVGVSVLARAYIRKSLAGEPGGSSGSSGSGEVW